MYLTIFISFIILGLWGSKVPRNRFILFILGSFSSSFA